MKIAEVDLLKESTYQTPCGTIHYWSNNLSLDTTTLVFLPGLTADHRLFDKQVEYFDGKYNIIVWDAPAHASSWPFRFDFDLFDKAKWLNVILEKEEIIKPIIIGQSMGGMWDRLMHNCILTGWQVLFPLIQHRSRETM